MATTLASRRSTRGARIAAIITMLAGAILAIAGVVTWFTVQGNLADERITVSDDSPRFAGDKVDGPLTAFQEAQMIETHYLESTGGKTYAEIDREDPLRQTAMTASFLRASCSRQSSPSVWQPWPWAWASPCSSPGTACSRCPRRPTSKPRSPSAPGPGPPFPPQRQCGAGAGCCRGPYFESKQHLGMSAAGYLVHQEASQG